MQQRLILLDTTREILQICGVNMGRNEYQVLNLRGEPMYQVQIGDKTYSVGVDGGVVPHAVRTASAADVLRIGFQHKQSTQDRAIFQTNNPNMSQVREGLRPVPLLQELFFCLITSAMQVECMQAEVAAPRPYTFEEGRDQAVCCLLAAHQLCQLPLDLDLTDGKHHHLLRLRGDFLLVYEDCTPTQVCQPCTAICLASSLQNSQLKCHLMHIMQLDAGLSMHIMKLCFKLHACCPS